ncbi:MAG: hypothetical protein ACT4OO_08910 [Nitrospiraceae bacterium]
MKRCHVLVLCGVGLISTIGCAGSGETIPVNVALKQSAGEMGGAHPGGLRVSIIPFEDDRADRTKLGMRLHARGGESNFQPAPGRSLGEATAQALATYLNKKGWQAQVVQAGTSGNSDADVTLSGKILDLSLNARGGVGFTDLTAKNKLAIHVKNHADGSSISDTVSHSGNYNVFWFEPQDGEDILGDVLEKNFEKFLLETRVDGKSLRLR